MVLALVTGVQLGDDVIVTRLALLLQELEAGRYCSFVLMMLFLAGNCWPGSRRKRLHTLAHLACESPVDIQQLECSEVCSRFALGGIRHLLELLHIVKRRT